MEKVNVGTLMEKYIMEIGSRGECMAMGFILGLMGNYTKEITTKTKSKGSASTDL